MVWIFTSIKLKQNMPCPMPSVFWADVDHTTYWVCGTRLNEWCWINISGGCSNLRLQRHTAWWMRTSICSPVMLYFFQLARTLFQCLNHVEAFQNAFTAVCRRLQLFLTHCGSASARCYLEAQDQRWEALSLVFASSRTSCRWVACYHCRLFWNTLCIKKSRIATSSFHVFVDLSHLKQSTITFWRSEAKISTSFNLLHFSSLYLSLLQVWITLSLQKTGQ